MLIFLPFVSLHILLTIHSNPDNSLIFVHKILESDLKLFYKLDNGQYKEIEKMADNPVIYRLCFTNFVTYQFPNKFSNIKYVLGEEEGLINVDKEVMKVRINDSKFIRGLISQLELFHDLKEIKREIRKFQLIDPSFSTLQKEEVVYDKLLILREQLSNKKDTGYKEVKKEVINEIKEDKIEETELLVSYKSLFKRISFCFIVPAILIGLSKNYY